MKKVCVALAIGLLIANTSGVYSDSYSQNETTCDCSLEVEKAYDEGYEAGRREGYEEGRREGYYMGEMRNR